MRSLLLLFLLCFALSEAQATRLTPSVVLNDNKGLDFPSDSGLREKDKVYIYSRVEGKIRLDGIAEVDKCLAYCRVYLKKARKGLGLTTNMIYSTTPLTLKPKSGPRSVEEKTVISTPSESSLGKKNFLYGSYGGPFLFGMQASYMNQFSERLRAGLTLGMVGTTINKVKLNGNYLSLRADMNLWNIDDWGVKVNPYAEAGYIQSTVDFSQLTGPKVKENLPFYGVGFDFWREWESFVAILRLGYTYNTFKESYVSDDFAFETPFDGGLLTYELGIGMKF